MRKLVSYLFITLDGVIESPDKFWRSDLFEDFPEITDLGIADQDAVLLGRKQYEEWSGFWPGSDIEPFSTFINNTPKLVVSGTLREVRWKNSTLIAGDWLREVARLKEQPGKFIGVHGSITLTESLLAAGLLDELRFAQLPVIAGRGRRLLEHSASSIQLKLQTSQTRPTGLQYLVYARR